MSAPAAKTHKEWREAMSVKLIGKGRHAYIQAACPLCDYTKSIDVSGSSGVSRDAAIIYVLGHLKAVHPESVRD